MGRNMLARTFLYLVVGLVVSWMVKCHLCDWVLTVLFLVLVGGEFCVGHNLIGLRRLGYYVCATLLCLAGLLLAYQAHATTLFR